MSIRVVLSYSGGSITLRQGVTDLGRSLECGIRFNDPTVSRHHTRVAVSVSGASVEDLDSSNGTFVNGKRVTSSRALYHGDELLVGNRALKVHVFEGEAGTVEPDTASRSGKDVKIAPSRHAPNGNGNGQAAPSAPAFVTCQACLGAIPPEAMNCPHCGRPKDEPSPLATTGIFSPEDIQKQIADQRRHERFGVEFPVMYASESLAFETLARDLSMGGLFLATDILDEIGATCALTLLPEGESALRLIAVVRRIQLEEKDGLPTGMGLEFDGLDEGANDWLVRVIHRADAPITRREILR